MLLVNDILIMLTLAQAPVPLPPGCRCSAGKPEHFCHSQIAHGYPGGAAEASSGDPCSQHEIESAGGAVGSTSLRTAPRQEWAAVDCPPLLVNQIIDSRQKRALRQLSACLPAFLGRSNQAQRDPTRLHAIGQQTRQHRRPLPQPLPGNAVYTHDSSVRPPVHIADHESSRSLQILACCSSR